MESRKQKQPVGEAGSSTSFLIAEYQGLLESFWRTEELGEKRFEFFITLVTAVLGALLVTKSFTSVPGIAAMGVLNLFGILTRQRIIVRNLRAHEYLRGMGRIRCYFKEREPESAKYMFYEPTQLHPTRTQQIGGWVKCLQFRTGGLLQTTSFICSLLGGAFVELVLWNFATSESISVPTGTGQILWTTLVALATSVVMWCWLMWHARYLYIKEEENVSQERECPNGNRSKAAYSSGQ